MFAVKVNLTQKEEYQNSEKYFLVLFVCFFYFLPENNTKCKLDYS